ncbi:asparagine synthase-related protein [Paraglaciecola sp. Hal342]
MTNNPKHGFGAPIKSWLNGPLNDWAEDLLTQDKIEQQGIFDSEKVALLWHDFKHKKEKISYTTVEYVDVSKLVPQSVTK